MIVSITEEKKRKLYATANKLLARNNFAFDGTPREKMKRGQRHFEKRIIMTPMGNGSR
ncbi:hypothetical protein IPF86_01845 [Candidatus Nomurabacteria bacterium]|jgi:hypothetical protein|nr:MAG: hypothetical protein IPF86_01845 [Candidatus Nomurabacteria bacterium]